MTWKSFYTRLLHKLSYNTATNMQLLSISSYLRALIYSILLIWRQCTSESTTQSPFTTNNRVQMVTKQIHYIKYSQIFVAVFIHIIPGYLLGLGKRCMFTWIYNYLCSYASVELMALDNDSDNHHKNDISMGLTHWHLRNVLGFFKLEYLYFIYIYIYYMYIVTIPELW